MFAWLNQLDRVLRGEATRSEEIAGGTLRVPIFGLSVVIDGLGLIYGLCMGLFAVTGHDTTRWRQIPASMVKVPALFLLTLIITVPSLYTFNALIGSRLKFLPIIRLMTASVAVMVAVLASMGPIVAFFSVSTTSYPFMVLLNVAFFTISGLLGLRFLLQTLRKLTQAIEDEESPSTVTPVEGFPPLPEGAKPVVPIARFSKPAASRSVRTVFQIWLLVFALVGAQMGWVLRPFIGDPNLPFHWFRPRQSNFFEAVAHKGAQLFGLEDEHHHHGARGW